MKKAPVKKTDLIESLKAATQAESCARWALALSLSEKPECVVHVKGDSDSRFISKYERYEYRLYGSRYSFGGVVIRIFRCKGQNDQIETNFLTDLYGYAIDSSVPAEIRSAVGKLKQAQREVIEAHGWYDAGSKQRSVPKLKATA